MADLGPEGKLGMELEDGKKLTVEGVPTKTKDRIVLMAQRVSAKGEEKKIKRN